MKTAAAAVIVAVLLFPLYWMVAASLQPAAAAPELVPGELTFAGYRTAWAAQGPHLAASFAVALGTVAVSLVTAAPAAYALARLPVPGGRVVVFALLVVQLVPGIVLANALYPVFGRLGLIDGYTGLVLADATATVPFAVLVLRAAMLAIPRELVEASRLDGAGHWRTFGSVVLPAARPALVTTGLFAFLVAWGDFLFAVTLTTGQSLEPVTVGIYRFAGGRSADWPAVLATAVLAAIPAAVLLVTAQRAVVTGLTGSTGDQAMPA